MAVNLPSNTWTESVLNPFGIQKDLPSGNVTVVYSKKDNSYIGYVHNGVFVQTVDKLPEGSEITKATKKPKQTGRTIKDVEQDTYDAYQSVQTAKLGIENYPVGSDKYNAAKAEFDKQTTNLQNFRQEHKQFLAQGQVTKVSSDLEKNQVALDRAKALGQDTTAISNKISDLSTKKDALALTATPTGSTGPTGGTGGSPIGRGGAALSAPTGAHYQGSQLVDANGKPIVAASTVTPSGKTSTGGVFTGKGKVPPAAVVTPEEAKSNFLAKYGVQAALVNSDPSLQKLFAAAMAGTWDAKRFAAEFANTTWAKTHAETWQNAETARLSAPATYAQSYNSMRDSIARLAGTMGEIIPPDQLGAAADPSKTYDRTGNIVEWALDQSWGKGVNTDQLRQHIAELGKINLSLPGGETGKAMTQLKSYATDMGMGNLALPGGNDYFAAAAQSIMLGKSDINTWQADILKNAKDKYKAFAPQFDAGQTLRTVAAPYINSLSNLLEIAPDQIDLAASTGYGKLISDAMNGSDPANPKPTALYDFEKAIKARPEWGYTNNARDTVMGGVHDLLKTFGKVS